MESFNRNSIFTFFLVLFCVIGMPEKNLLPGGLNYILYIIFVVLSFFTLKRKLQYPPKYLLLLLLLATVFFVNAIISPYINSVPLFVLGVFITVLPFVNFIICYNYFFSNSGVSKAIDKILFTTVLICLFVYVESFVMPRSDTEYGFTQSKVFALGFVASMCNQCTILSITQYWIKQKRKYIYFSLFFIIFVLQTLQLKAIFGVVLVLFIYLYQRLKNNVLKYTLPPAFVAMFVVSFFTVPQVAEKVSNYSEIYLSEGAEDGVARNALYFTAIHIARDYFPLGTGQGTYGSVPSKLSDERVMNDYGINHIYGLDGGDPDFRLDTHWAYILGENGYLGMLLYLILFFFPILLIRKIRGHAPEYKAYRFFVTLSILVLTIESFALPLPNRLNFIFIYCGLTAIMIRCLKIKEIQSK